MFLITQKHLDEIKDRITKAMQDSVAESRESCADPSKSTEPTIETKEVQFVDGQQLEATDFRSTDSLDHATLNPLDQIMGGDGDVVTWKNLQNVNVEESPGSLKKNAGSSSTSAAGWDAGATSVQELTSPSTQAQGVTFKCDPSGSSSYAGLTNGAVMARNYPMSIDFAIYCTSDGMLGVYESGTEVYSPTSSLKFTTTDVLNVRVTGTTVNYLKNDVVYYTSTTAATFPLQVDVVLHGMGTRIFDAKLILGTSFSDNNLQAAAPVAKKYIKTTIVGCDEKSSCATQTKDKEAIFDTKMNCISTQQSSIKSEKSIVVEQEECITKAKSKLKCIIFKQFITST